MSNTLKRFLERNLFWKKSKVFFLLAREIPFQETGLTIFSGRNKQLFSKPRKDLVLSLTTADGNNQDSFALKLMTFYLNRTVNKLAQR